MLHSAVAPNPVLEEIVRFIVEQYAPHRIVLFGSHARGEATSDSDYDLMVEVDDSRRHELDMAIAIALFEKGWDVDAVVMTPGGYDAAKDDVGMLAYEIEREGKVLYARDGIAGRSIDSPKRVSEPRRASSRSIALWTRRAENDFSMMKAGLAVDDPITDGICFHAHQCAEKYLKTVIVSTHRVPPRTHRLGKLLDLCPDSLLRSRSVRHACAVLLRYYRFSRYPDECEPTEPEAREAAGEAGIVRDATRAVLLSASE